MTTRQTFLLLALTMLAAIATGFVLEYGFNVLPCHMCWQQRYGHMLLAALGLWGAVRPCKHVWPFVAATAGATLAIALWQTAAQHGWLPFPPGCTGDATATMAGAADLFATLDTTKVVACDAETFTLFGFTLANYNILLMLGVIGWSQFWWTRQKAA